MFPRCYSRAFVHSYEKGNKTINCIDLRLSLKISKRFKGKASYPLCKYNKFQLDISYDSSRPGHINCQPKSNI